MRRAWRWFGAEDMVWCAGCGLVWKSWFGAEDMIKKTCISRFPFPNFELAREVMQCLGIHTPNFRALEVAPLKPQKVLSR